ncbi:MAG: 6-carboxytetrahydropterin synthase [Gemmatimonadota bacterium]|jgi:6-pyruvoyltetrahydropterin/6-carboxytetrahydropterin synthase
MNAYRITVSKEHLVFAAGHFITYGGGECETLHGHNYRSGVTLSGGMDENALVFDFVLLKRELESIVGPLDHRMLLPSANPLLEIQTADGEVHVRHGERHYLFPEADVVILPIQNTTAEMLATWILDRLVERMAARGASSVHEIEVEVEESFGQSAFCRRRVAF